MTRKTWKISRRRMICRAGWCLYLPAFLPPDPRPRTKKEREREISGPCLASGSATRRSPTATARCLSPPPPAPREERKSPAPNRSAPSSDRDPAFERLPCPHRPTCPGSRHQTKPNLSPPSRRREELSLANLYIHTPPACFSASGAAAEELHQEHSRVQALCFVNSLPSCS
jgi:hypothetical protein